MNLKGIMSSLGAQPGQVISDPYARAFAPQPSVKEEVVNEEDHEVSMAQNQLDSIIKNATELKGKVGEQEKNIAGWIQDHITNAENYIEQANTGYHELDESLNEEFKHIISVETPTQVLSKPIAAQIEKLARQGVRASEIGLKMGFVGNQKVATDAFQKLKNQIYFKLNKSESVNEDVSITNGDYHFWSKGGVAHLDYKGKEIASGDFDSGADAYFLSHSSFKGQKAFDSGKDVLNYFRTKRITDESINEIEYKDAIEKFNADLMKNSQVERIAQFHKKSVKDVVKALQPYLKVLRYSDKSIKVVSIDFRDTNSDVKVHSSQTYKQNESVNEARLTDIVKTIVETPVIGKMVSKAPSTTQVIEAKKYDIGSGWMGNGLTIWNRAEEQYGDYKIIAHISDNGTLSIRDKALPSDIKKMFQIWADSMKKGNRPGTY